jgi:hemoglobin-like flavoprotein
MAAISPPFAAAVEESLGLLAERCPDPTPAVYARLFAQQPRMQAHFWRDADGAVKGEMLSRTFALILDLVGDGRYAAQMIGTEMVTHEGYDIPREVFATFFGVVRETAREILGDDWTPAYEAAWDGLLAEIGRLVLGVPRSDVTSDFHRERVAAFEAKFADGAV